MRPLKMQRYNYPVPPMAPHTMPPPRAYQQQNAMAMMTPPAAPTTTMYQPIAVMPPPTPHTQFYGYNGYWQEGANNTCSELNINKVAPTSHCSTPTDTLLKIITLTSTNPHDWAIVDSGSSSHFLTTAAPFKNMQPATTPIRAKLPNGDTMEHSQNSSFT